MEVGTREQRSEIKNISVRKGKKKSTFGAFRVQCALFSCSFTSLFFSTSLLLASSLKSAGKPTLLFNKQNVLRHYKPRGAWRGYKQNERNLVLLRRRFEQQLPSLTTAPPKRLKLCIRRRERKKSAFCGEQQRTALRENKCERKNNQHTANAGKQKYSRKIRHIPSHLFNLIIKKKIHIRSRCKFAVSRDRQMMS